MKVGYEDRSDGDWFICGGLFGCRRLLRTSQEGFTYKETTKVRGVESCNVP